MKKPINSAEIPLLKTVTENIYLLSLPVPFGMNQVNCYLFQGEKGFTVLDTGFSSEEAIGIWESILSFGIVIEKIILTHFHIDHLGLARWFREKHGVPVFISSLGYEEMKRRQKKDYADWVFNMFIEHGGPDLSKRKREDHTSLYQFQADGVFEEGQSIQLGNEIYETIWTPGHSADHYCFYQPEREIMVVGDHILEKISPVILAESPSDVNPLANYFRSLHKMEHYSIQLALPGHGQLIENVQKRMDQIRAGHEYRIGQILNMISNENKTAWQMTQEIYGESIRKSPYSPLMATITRCIYLQSIGKVDTELQDEKIFYRLKE
jgi:glyoxylase-like metal-dependent hydrolase (beta-lactamase superfamily II)